MSRVWSDRLASMSADALTSTFAPAPPGLPACAQVDLGAVRDNVAALKEHAGRAEVMAVVKADAYGHGLLPSARAALRGGATWLGVAQLRRGPRALRGRRRSTRPCSAWLHVPGQDFAEAVRRGIDLSASRPVVPGRRRHDGTARRASPPASTSRSTPGSAATAPAGDVARRRWRSSSPLAGRGRAQPRRGLVALRLRRRAAAPDGARPAGALRGIVAQAERAGLRPRGAPPGQLRGDPDQPVRPLRPGAARGWRSTGSRRCRTSAARRTSGSGRRCA